MTDEKKIDQAAEIIKNSQNVVVFTGAGHSTESGIDDFRSSGGLWDRYDPSIYASYYSFLQDPSKFWQMHNELENILVNAKPNQGHFAIVELEIIGKLKAIITQNIDMLHQRAGSGTYKNIPIFELHGSYGSLICVRCRKEYNYEDIDTKSVDFPVCDCSGYIKPKVVLFGEALPLKALEGAMEASSHCDCFILIGSSLTVAPANLMPGIAKDNGAKIIFINRGNTEMDYLADVFLKDYASIILTRIIEKLKK